MNNAPTKTKGKRSKECDFSCIPLSLVSLSRIWSYKSSSVW